MILLHVGERSAIRVEQSIEAPSESGGERNDRLANDDRMHSSQVVCHKSHRQQPPAYTEPTLRVLREAVRTSGLALRIAGDSMEPALGRGTVVAVRPARIFWPGDLVAYVRRDSRLVVHRVLGYRPGRRWSLLTQADIADEPDAAVPLDRVIGRVIAPDKGSVALRHRLRAAMAFVSRASMGAMRRLS